MINATPGKIEAFVAGRLEQLRAATGLELAVSGSKIEHETEVLVYVRPHDHNLASERFVGEFAIIEEAAEQEFDGISVMLIPDYACE